MKKSILFLPVILVLVFISPGLYAQADHVSNINDGFTFNPNADRDINMVSDFMQAFFVDRDFDKARQFFKSDAMDYGPGASDSATVDQMMESMQKMNDNIKGWNIQYIAKLSVEVKEGNSSAPPGDWVFLWGNISAQSQSGKTITVPFHSVFKIEDGKIALEGDYYDNLPIIKQMGYNVAPPSGSE